MHEQSKCEDIHTGMEKCLLAKLSLPLVSDNRANCANKQVNKRGDEIQAVLGNLKATQFRAADVGSKKAYGDE